jgi:hypothetical protein
MVEEPLTVYVERGGSGTSRVLGKVDPMMAFSAAASAGDRVFATDPVTMKSAGSYRVPVNDTIFRFFPNPPSYACGLEDSWSQTCAPAPTRTDDMVYRRQLQHTEPWAVAGRAATNRVRLRMLQKHSAMIPHYTAKGYTYLPAGLPEDVWTELRSFYDAHRHDECPEGWKADNNYVNHWESPTYMVFLPMRIKNMIFAALKPMLEEWIDHKESLTQTACYGIRVYKNNSALLNHVDVLETHVVSAIIQVDQDVDEDWPVEIVDHDGNRVRQVLQPRDVVLYESASTEHGRPTNFRGRYFANVFAHFKPTDWKFKGDYNA